MTLEEEIKRAENKLYYELPKEEAKAIIAAASKLSKQRRLEILPTNLIENIQIKNYEFCLLDYVNYNGCDDWN